MKTLLLFLSHFSKSSILCICQAQVTLNIKKKKVIPRLVGRIQPQILFKSFSKLVKKFFQLENITVDGEEIYKDFQPGSIIH